MQTDKPSTDKRKRDNRTVAQKRRAEYQEQQREYLRGLGLVREVMNDIEIEHDEKALPLVKWRNETRLKLINKILPDLKQTEVTQPDGEDFNVNLKSEELVETAAALARKLQGG